MLKAEDIKNSVDIVDIIGRYVHLEKQGSGYKGCCPFHGEKTPSFNVNPSLQTFKCFGCQEGGDVIDFIQKHNNLDFKGAAEYLGADIDPDQPPPQKRPKKEKAAPAVAVPLPYQAAKDHYTKETMQSYADNIYKASGNPRTFKQAWAYKNDKGEVELVAARFEDDQGKKDVLSFYWNGRTLKMKAYPVLLFNRDRLAAEPNKPVLIVEGEKSAEAAAVMQDFIPVTWNGGGKKVKDADWSILKDREVFIYPDDDHKMYGANTPRAGQLMPPEKQPGNQTAAEIKKALPHARLVKPLPEAKEIKQDGADIVEALEVLAPDALTGYILSNSEQINPPKTPDLTSNNNGLTFPFTVLGVADDGKAYFIGENERMYALNPMSISKVQLFNLTDLAGWKRAYEEDFGKGAKMWEQAISDVIFTANETDFDPDRMRGRGGWREDDGRICYHDGKKTTGEISPDRIYLRRAVKNIGITGKQATAKERERICEAAQGLTFDSTADCVKTLGWSLLAPFAGALSWRPAGLLTAASGTGKTTIVNCIVKPLAMPIICSGGESTSAGIRQRIGVDSCAFVVEEAETDTQKKKQNRDETFSLMRQSTSDDSPDVLKGTIDGKGLSFKLRSMFFFVSISPEVECEADENRIFRISLVKPNYKRSAWLKKERELKKAVTAEICKKVRSFTWNNIKNIIALSERVATQAQLIANIDNRTALAESLLIAAYIAVFKDKPEADDDFIIEFVKLFYSLGIPEKRRNENEEMVDTLLDSIIKDGSHSYTLREVLSAIETEKIWSNEDELNDPNSEDTKPVGQDMPSQYARRLAGMYGLGLAADGNIAIAKNHHEIMRFLDKGKGYQMQLMRHPRLVDRSKNVSLGSGNVKNCVVIGWENNDDD